VKAIHSTIQSHLFPGIHGLPSVPWDNVQKTVGGNWSGYCAHGVMAFPTWHRPYLALLEVKAVSMSVYTFAKK
jgi:tyrosinase